jgi:hypothetical protein
VIGGRAVVSSNRIGIRLHPIFVLFPFYTSFLARYRFLVGTSNRNLSKIPKFAILLEFWILLEVVYLEQKNRRILPI